MSSSQLKKCVFRHLVLDKVVVTLEQRRAISAHTERQRHGAARVLELLEVIPLASDFGVERLVLMRWGKLKREAKASEGGR